ncbi:MAG: hypothetical protein HC849_20795 [Oscillatoriales cyanobacterium RU_3_3]|nr:hypothetical protein [Microcoleus sp. SU_5_6]NJM62091.1 hypothetical protein [Oscillatoriales cyanobacterium RU_3_3]NJR23980.1 hypothetical protein [Richelia sp. CSU_2_1]
MQLEISDIELPIDADIIALDRDDRAVMLIEVKIIQEREEVAKQRIVDRTIDWIKAVLAKMSDRNTLIPYAMFVDMEQILILKWDGVNLSEPVCSLNTDEILRHYEPEFGKKRIFKRYLTRLVEAWLRDLAYNWKSKIPPASEQIAKIGVMPLLAGGTTKSRVEIGGNFIYRD